MTSELEEVVSPLMWVFAWTFVYSVQSTLILIDEREDATALKNDYSPFKVLERALTEMV
jgi:hypothetical protein